MRRLRGHTLIELMVTSALFLLALGLVGGLFEYGLNLFAKNEARGDSQSEAVKLMSQFQRDLGAAPWASVSMTYVSNDITQGDLAISWQTFRDDNGGGVINPDSALPFYQAHQVYFTDISGKTVHRLRIPLAPPTLEISPMSRVDLIASLTLPSQTSARGVLSWTALDYVTGVPTSLVENPSRFQLVVQSPRQVEPQRLEFRCKQAY